MIEFKNISISYKKKVLDKLSFRLEDGDKLGIFGQTGIGKSTIIKLILDLREADRGEIIRTFTKPAVVFQENRLIEEISALDNLKLVTNDEKEAKEILKRFAISDYEQRIVDLSGGMQRKVALARAYVLDGDILILDEPFTGIDKASRNLIAKILKERYEGKTIILISHDPSDFNLFNISKDSILYL